MRACRGLRLWPRLLSWSPRSSPFKHSDAGDDRALGVIGGGGSSVGRPRRPVAARRVRRHAPGTRIPTCALRAARARSPDRLRRALGRRRRAGGRARPHHREAGAERAGSGPPAGERAPAAGGPDRLSGRLCARRRPEPSGARLLRGGGLRAGLRRGAPDRFNEGQPVDYVWLRRALRGRSRRAEPTRSAGEGLRRQESPPADARRPRRLTRDGQLIWPGDGRARRSSGSGRPPCPSSSMPSRSSGV